MKSSFIVHLDSLDVIDDLTDEQCGELLRAMKAYHLQGDYTPSSIVKVAFSPFKNQFIRDEKKYQATVTRNQTNGKKGGRPKNEALETQYGKLVPDNANGNHFIYLIHDIINNEYKIGETQNLKQRRYDIKRPTNNLVICDFALLSTYDAQQLENEIIVKYQSVRISGDWFKFTEQHKTEVVNLFSQKTQSVNSNPKKADSDSKSDNGSGSGNDSASDNKKETIKLKAKSTKGCRLSQDTLPDEWKSFCMKDRPDLNPESTFDCFKDYWAGVAGAKGVKLDWPATWRNWVRRQEVGRKRPQAEDKGNIMDWVHGDKKQERQIN